MFWDDLIERWRRGSRAESRPLIRGATGSAAVLPAPGRERRRRWLLLLVATVVAVFLLSSQHPTTSPASAVPNASVLLP